MADATANRSPPTAASCACGGGCPRCQASPATAAGSTGAALPSLDTQKETGPASLPTIVQAGLASAGTTLNEETRAQMESRFEFDFSQVRIHASPRAANSAAALSARAYTVGTDIVFGRNQYSPASSSGRKLIAHELAHVVQQRGKASGTPRAISTTGEQEAAAASEAATAGHPVRVGPISAPGVQREAQSFDQAKQSVLEELHRSMPAAILPMLDFMDAPIRAQLQNDPDVLSAIKGLPKGAQAIVMKHLMKAGPAAATQAQPKPAEQIPFSTSPDYESFGLHGDNAQQAVAIFGRTDVANRLVNWLAKNKIQSKIEFLARRKNLPSGKGDAGGVDGTYERSGQGFTVYVMGSDVSIGQDGAATDNASDRRAGEMAKTIFHELLHVWFINAAKLSPSDPFYTGHTAEVKPPAIGLGGGTTYDEQNYDPQFLAKLKEFDAELAARKQQAAARP
ncbi:MAG TPA: DUF4157 domain-containing protein [Opitutaceae bacterium]|jgi:hypothetical protein|nr:DUF4157 domain-containing protein [Opitutaceae bacterium]